MSDIRKENGEYIDGILTKFNYYLRLLRENRIQIPRDRSTFDEYYNLIEKLVIDNKLI
jgi:hypothetical protein